jgi:hypothetical protein
MARPSHEWDFIAGKVRMLEKVPPGLARDQAWVAVRPYPPGIEPAFFGSVWLHFDGPDSVRSPRVHFRPRGAGDVAGWQIAPLTDRKLGASTLLDQRPGWRRIDFLVQLPARDFDLDVSVEMTAEANPASPAPPLGTLSRAEGVWRFQRPGSNPFGANPFATDERPALQPAFVGGAPKSGTTWLQMLLNQHPMIFAQGEGSLLGMVSAMRDWSQANHWLPQNMTRAALSDFGNQAVLLRLLNVFRDFSGCGIVVDKSPGNARFYRRLLAFVPGARLLHCVRHPLDVVISSLHHEMNMARAGAPSRPYASFVELIALLPDLLGAPGPLALDDTLWPLVARILDNYIEFQAEALVLAREPASKLMIVRYEDMLDNPDEFVPRIFAHVGAPSDPALVAQCIDNVSFGNLREKRGGGDHVFFRAGTSGQYETLILPEYRARIEAYLRASMPRFDDLGYSLERSAVYRAA